MKPEKILYAMNNIDGQFLREAREDAAPSVKSHRRRFTVLIAAVIALMAVTLTAFAAEEIAGWFRQYFTNQSDTPLTPGQIEFIEENEQVIAETQTHNGYSLELKSVLSDTKTVYVTLGVTAPAEVTYQDLENLCGLSMDFYDKNGVPAGAWRMQVTDGTDNLENTVDLVMDLNPATWNSEGLWTLRIDELCVLIYDEAYEQELLDTKYAGQENIMFTDEEAARIYRYETLAEGPWEFAIDLNQTNNAELEMITVPVTAQTCYGYKPDGTEVLEEVQITSFVLRPLGATIKAESIGALDFTYNADQRIFVVMSNGNRIELFPNWGAVGEQHLEAESPIILDEVDYVLLSDGTKLMVP